MGVARWERIICFPELTHYAWRAGGQAAVGLALELRLGFVWYIIRGVVSASVSSGCGGGFFFARTWIYFDLGREGLGNG